MAVARTTDAEFVHPNDQSSRLQTLWHAAQDAWTARRQAQMDRRAVAKAMAELSALDDLMLHDMGISRCGIHAAVTSNL